MGEKSRVAYLITSHRLPSQVLRLASILRQGSPSAVIAIHHDDRHCHLDRHRLAALRVDLIEPPSVVEWGDFSHLAMLVRCLCWLLTRTDFQWLVLLSGQDYPIRRVPEIERHLAAADGEVDAFIETVPCPRPPLRRTPDEFALRYHYRWWRMPRPLVARLAPLVAHLRPLLLLRDMPSGLRLAVPAARSPFGPDLVCHHGSDWFTLSRAAAEAIEHVVQARPAIYRYYRHTLSPSESFFQTVLANDANLKLSGDHGRYIVFPPHDMSHPRVLRLEDLDVMLASPARFARKFDESVDAAVLDEIDRRVHSR